MKIFSGFFAVIFLLFAAVQYNDIDPQVWVPVYLYACALSALIFFKRYYPILIIAGVIGYFGAAVYIFTPGVFNLWIEEEMANASTGMRTPLIEEGREFWGLVICFVVSTVYFFRAINKNKISILR